MKKSDSLKKWIKHLQRESWQLELVVSAFSIFLLISSIDKVLDAIQFVLHNYAGLTQISLVQFLGVFYAAITIFSFHLIIHLFIRGLWIGIIGLSSVSKSDSLNFDNYSPLFKSKLDGKILSLDELTIQLDKFASVLFALAYLVLFSIFSLLSALIILNMGVNALGGLIDLITNKTIHNGLESIFTFFVFTLLVMGIIYMLDFLTLGYVFKRFKILSKIYYPVYVFFGLITFSFLYKSIYYVFISKFKKKYLFSLIAIYFIFFLLKPEVNFFIFSPQEASMQLINNNTYDNLRDKDDWIENISIQNDIISDSYLKVFIRYNASDNALIKKLCPTFEPEIKEGVQSPFSKFQFSKKGITTTNISGIKTSKEKAKEMMQCLKSFYILTINDSIYSDLDYEFSKHPNKQQMGIITYVRTDYLKKDKNVIQLFNNYNLKDTSFQTLKARIPFWVE